MPTYFIHFTNAHDRFHDLEGVEMPDDEAARDYAVLDACYLMDEGFVAASEWSAWSVEVVDEAERKLLALTFAEIEAQRRSAH